MANFTESIAAILRAIDGLGLLPLQRRNRDARPGTFLAVASAFLSRTVDDRVVTNVLEALEGVGWAGASVLAKVDQGDIEGLFESSGIRGLTKSIKPLLKLAQWFTDEIGDEAEGTHATESLREGLRSSKCQTQDRVGS